MNSTIIGRFFTSNPTPHGKVAITAYEERRTAMNGRREFLKGSLVFAGAAIAGSAAPVQAASTFPVALIYTKEAPGGGPARRALTRRR